MKFIKHLAILLIISSFVISCKHEEKRIDFFILSKQDNVLPPPPISMEFYTNLVMIFDTANKVYLYQTECKFNEGNGKANQFKIGPSTRYPNFIGLNPNHLITLQSDYLISFLKNNDEYFKLDTNYHDANRLLYIVSDVDTITNKGFYDLMDYIKTCRSTKGRIIYLIRKATEEEHNVLKCKRTMQPYLPTDFNWSTNFIDGKTNPLSARYDSLERQLIFVMKSKETYPPKVIDIKRIE